MHGDDIISRNDHGWVDMDVAIRSIIIRRGLSPSSGQGTFSTVTPSEHSPLNESGALPLPKFSKHGTPTFVLHQARHCQENVVKLSEGDRAVFRKCDGRRSGSFHRVGAVAVLCYSDAKRLVQRRDDYSRRSPRQVARTDPSAAPSAELPVPQLAGRSPPQTSEQPYRSRS